MVAQWAITRSFIEEDRTLQVKLAVNITYALALVSVALRFVSRRLARSQLWWDDLFVVLAMVCQLLYQTPWLSLTLVTRRLRLEAL